MKILRASIAQLPDAQLLLAEYYEAVGVMVLDQPAALAAYLSEQASGLWIAYVEAVPAGCVVLRPLPSLPQSTECKRLYVRPQFRGHGVAQALLNELENYAQASNANWVYLDSKDDLKDALRLYIARGYEPCERYNDNPQATVFLRKNLTSAEI
jgi:GNAT superfamily N-acetyltransferase